MIFIYYIYFIYIYIYIYIYISEHKQNAHNDGNRAQPLKRHLETVPRHKEVHWVSKSHFKG